ncbi:MAG: NADPH-dependent glutamate synthase [Clostridia bacterium]|nr:NADPH-dependent glutamate synthase [Clostridia bacterium]
MSIPKPSVKERMAIERCVMDEQAPLERAGNFGEVNLGLSMEIALKEAQRCLECKNPTCVNGCPVNVNIPRFIGFVMEGKMEDAALSLATDNALPAVTGRVCPQETQCECVCIRGKKGKPVAIGYLERFVADWARANMNTDMAKAPATGKKVAVIGAGPAGLTAAGELVRKGHDVTVYEALQKTGGVLVYGIPEFRLPKKIVQSEVDRLVRAGVKIETNVVVGRTWTIDELREKFDAIFIANGAGLPVFMNVPGENLKGVYSANEYLTRVNLMKAYQFPLGSDTPVIKGKRVCVVGGGNVAMDAVRTAKRLGAEEAIIVYRRSKVEMPARVEEVHHAEAEGIRFEMLTAPLEVVGDENHWVTGLKCQRMELGEPDASGRRRPVPVAGSEFVLDCDVVVVAIGTRANPLLTATCPEMKLNKYGNILVDEKGMTTIPGVFAGGDIVRGAATVILAMGDGKRAASEISDYLKK